jgi:hypothetical protein
MTELRKSTPQQPLLQEEVLRFVKENPDEVFEVAKIKIPVKQTKARHQQWVNTVTIARDGRRIKETSQTVPEGYGVDTRVCVDGSLDQYAKKPARVKSDYTFDDGRSFDELDIGETAQAHTKRQEVRQAFVAPFDMWLKATWGQVQFVARGGIVTISNGEAIGNNNPCDMVVWTSHGAGREVLTKAARVIRYDLEQQGIPICRGAEKFLKTAAKEDMKSPYISKWNDFRLWMKEGMEALQSRLKMLLADKTKSKKCKKHTPIKQQRNGR